MRSLPIANEKRYYVSLGDSQSRNAQNYMGAASRFYERLAASDSFLKMVPLATDGATASAVRYVQLPRLREMHVAPSVLTVTLGVSDLPRLAFGDAETVCRELRGGVDALLSVVRSASPRAIVLLSTLYDPMDGTHPVLEEGVRRFNETVRETASVHGAAIAEIHTAFAGHGASAGDPLSSWRADTPRDLYLCAGPDLVPVPTERGATVFADLLWTGYRAALTEATPLVSDFTEGGAPL